MIATIVKFYQEIFQTTVNLKHPYPQRKLNKL